MLCFPSSRSFTLTAIVFYKKGNTLHHGIVEHESMSTHVPILPSVFLKFAKKAAFCP